MAVGGVLILATSAFFLWPKPSPEIEPIPQDPAVAAAPEDTSNEEESYEDEFSDADDAGPEPEVGREADLGEEGLENLEEMEGWVEKYDELMAPLALILDEIDFEGIDPSRCQTLRRNLGAVASRLGSSPDAEVDSLVQDALGTFGEAQRACRANDESAWALALLEGKASTHEAQEIMNDRYLYRGVLELELEGATGVDRSTESISGRFLSSSRP